MPEQQAEQPAPLHMITSLEALKVFSDPLRQQIIEALMEGAKTVKQVAAELELAPTKLYYHVNLLEEHGLIQVTETRIVSGIIEKRYMAAALEFAIERTLLTPGSSGKGEVLNTIFDAMIEPIRSDLQKSLEQGLIDMRDDAPVEHKFRMWRASSQLAPEQAQAFYERLGALIEEFSAFKENDANADAQHYTLLISIAPITSPKKTPKA